MTERGRRQLRQDASSLRIGSSGMHWDGQCLTVEIDEITVPWPSSLAGVVRLYPQGLVNHPVELAVQGRHRWSPIAPRARVEVALRRPDLRWSGSAYFDSNRGDAPLEQAFRRWDWSRMHLSNRRSAVLYDIERLGDEPLSLGMTFDEDGRVTPLAPPPPVALPKSAWGIARRTRSDAAEPARLTRTLVDAPFYARSLVRAGLLGEPVTAYHESLSLQRFDTRWVQAMLPFRMPRRVGR